MATVLSAATLVFLGTSYSLVRWLILLLQSWLRVELIRIKSSLSQTQTARCVSRTNFSLTHARGGGEGTATQQPHRGAPPASLARRAKLAGGGALPTNMPRASEGHSPVQLQSVLVAPPPREMPGTSRSPPSASPDREAGK